MPARLAGRDRTGRSVGENTVVNWHPSLLVTSIVAAVAFAPASARPTIKVDPNPVHRGDRVRVHGAVPGCRVGNSVTLISRAFSHRHDFAGLPAVFARVGVHHRYSVRTRVPDTRAPALYRISGRCGGGNLGVSVRLRVLP
jgi:hypothetical protein